MNYDYPQTDFSKALLAGLFAGISATLANLVYDYLYRDITAFSPSEIINVTSIILITTLILTITGVIYYFFRHYIRKGTILYTIFLAIVILIAIYFAMQTQRSIDPIVSSEFRKLLLGIILISGVAGLLIPYLYKHHNVFS